ncbi:MAG: hypothetical protein U0746_18105 [Gemmataceae bacterium]
MTFGKLLFWRLTVPGVVRLVPPGLRVAHGPFAGMHYVAPRAFGSSLSAKLLGSYECELHPVVRDIQTMPFRRLIDVGAAEGYYAVGFAMTMPGLAEVVAFEDGPEGRSLLSRMAARNGQERIDVRGRCELADLSTVVADGRDTLVVCDTEGYEDVLLNPSAVEGLGRCHVLVETHDFLRPGVTDELCRRFSPSHHVTRILSRPRLPSDFPGRNWAARLAPSRLLLRAVGEGRPGPMTWLWMTPLAVASAG